MEFQIKDVGAHKNAVHSGVSSQSNNFIAAIYMHVPLLYNTLW